MTTETEIQFDMAAEETRVEETGADASPLVDTLGKVALASIGAVSLTLEAAEKLLKRMMERGAADERNARRMLKDFRPRRPHLPRPHRPVITVGAKNLASKADIQALEQQVAALSARLDHLTTAPPEVPDHGAEGG